jgi:hypothetical protein
MSVYAQNTLLELQGLTPATTTATTTGTAAYLGARRPAAALPPGSPLSTPGYSAINTFTRAPGAIPSGMGFGKANAFRPTW